MRQINCDALLFDLDGVLIDSTVCIVRHWQQWAKKHNLNLDDIMSIAHGRRSVETIQLVAPQLAAEEEAERFAAVEAADTKDVVLLEGAGPLLRLLPSNAWAIVTSGSKNVATARLNQTGLPIPDILITADDVTKGKPDPEPYLLAAEKLAIPPERCVVIEDAPAGIDSALSAGMQTIAITTTHDPHSFGQEQVMVDTLSQLEIVENRDEYRLSIEIRSI